MMMMKTMNILFKLALAALLAGLVTVAHAGAFSVTPVRLFFEQRDRAIAVTLVNEGDSEIALQADINTWTQDANGVDKLELTEDLIVAPPSLKLAPRGRQVIRLALTAPRDASRQMTYRLIVREVPEVTAPKDGNLTLPIALVLSMPVFITPPAAKRQVEFSMSATKGPAPELVVANTGGTYAQLREVELKRDGKTLARFEGSSYVLPGARKSLALKGNEATSFPSGPAELVVTFDDAKPQTFRVTVP